MSVNSGDEKLTVTPDSLAALSRTASSSPDTEQDSQPRGIDAAGRRVDGPHAAPDLVGVDSTPNTL